MSHDAFPDTPDARRERLRQASGSRFWRSLDELAETPEFTAMLHREFPRQASELPAGFDRRRFLQVAGASLAAAGMSACSKQPPEKIVPYVRQPEEVIPGRPLYFATTALHGGYAQGVLAESHMGRPTKLEGNPDHPASLGATDLFAQAATLDLYDPFRSQAVLERGRIRTWQDFVDDLTRNVGALEAIGGRGLRILTGAVTSPTFGSLLGELLAKLPEARWHRWEPVTGDGPRRAVEAAFGGPASVRYDLSQADVVLAVDSDFLTTGPGAVRYAHDFAARRRVRSAAEAREGTMARLWSLESAPTATSTVADQRLALRPSELGQVLLAVAGRLGVAGVPGGGAELAGDRARFVDALVADLGGAAGRGLVVPGEQLDPELQVLVHGINDRLGNLGRTVLVTEPVEVEPPTGRAGTLEELAGELARGEVDTLLVLGSNPVYSAPADLDFKARMAEARLRIHLGSHRDETALLCQWHVPEAHFLEAWFDARAYDGTVSIGQPLIQPLYQGKTALAVLAALVGRAGTSDHDLVREHWQRELGGGGNGEEGDAAFERAWRRILHDGIVPDTAAAPRAASVAGGAVTAAARTVASWVPGDLELVFRPDPTVLDGRYATNGWLQECPKPITKLTWDNALLLSPRTARELGLKDPFQMGDQRGKAQMVTVGVEGASLELPVWIVPGHADGTGTVHIGHGRMPFGDGDVHGFDVRPLRSTASPWRARATVAPTGGTYLLASTQDHHSMEGRDLVRAFTAARIAQDTEHLFHEHPVDPSLSLMPGWEYDSYAWGMSVDLTTCTSCNACVIACNAENNIPVVGKEQVAAGREMHWIRIDRYFSSEAIGAAHEPGHGGDTGEDVAAIFNQPVFCMQCEEAPCEVVCPVAATVHSDEGLNDMVYNRCVGTRYCSNNCPYKVRRFNFLLYQDFDTPSLQLGRNPDVTVRSRGVMEKCTYCVQRINQARIDAKRQGRQIRDGAIQTACQQACPSGVLVFGDQSDPSTAVARAKSSPLDYGLLEELGTRPRTTYLAQVRNPHPSLAPAPAAGHGDGHDVPASPADPGPGAEGAPEPFDHAG